MILFLAVSEHVHDFSIFHVRFRFPCLFPLSMSVSAFRFLLFHTPLDAHCLEVQLHICTCTSVYTGNSIYLELRNLT